MRNLSALWDKITVELDIEWTLARNESGKEVATALFMQLCAAASFLSNSKECQERNDTWARVLPVTLSVMYVTATTLVYRLELEIDQATRRRLIAVRRRAVRIQGTYWTNYTEYVLHLGSMCLLPILPNSPRYTDRLVEAAESLAYNDSGPLLVPGNAVLFDITYGAYCLNVVNENFERLNIPLFPMSELDEACAHSALLFGDLNGQRRPPPANRVPQVLVSPLAAHVAAAAKGAGNVEERIRKILVLEPTSGAWSSSHWAGLLGVSGPAVRQTTAWRDIVNARQKRG